MFAARFVEENAELITATLAARRSHVDMEEILGLLHHRKFKLEHLQGLQAERNSGSKEVGALFKAGKRDEAQAKRERLALLGKEIAQLDSETKDLQAKIDGLLLTLPNLLADNVPDGGDEESNIEVASWGEVPEFDFEAKDHHDLGEELGILNFEQGAKVTGSRFTVLHGGAARLSRALMMYFLDQNTAAGYGEVLPPFIVNADSLRGTSQLPKFGDDLFRLQNPDNYYLVPTAEVPVTNLHAGEILPPGALPKRYTAYTPCFRAEAGSYGRDTRGLIRQHQFEKVELVQIVAPEDSEQAHEDLTGQSEALLQALGLHYRKMLLSSGDTSFAAWRCYDLEVWLPGQGAYREISSCSNFRDFQARRAGIRFRREAGAKPEFAHTLNGSALPLGRTLVAVMENYQQADGTITVPDVLRPYMGGVTTIGGV
ncbi:MAG: serine--tRNA ligase [Deltaproteobacteria bacterium]|nr:serine--tRNA ligase [Deltaproteobacteria bacterium]